MKGPHHLTDGVGLPDGGEELVAQTLPLRCAPYQPGDVDEGHRGRHHRRTFVHDREHLESGIGNGDDADIGIDRGEGVVGREHLVVGERVEEGRLAHVGQADDANGETHGAGEAGSKPAAAASTFRSASGRAPVCEITSAAQSPPNRVLSTGPIPWVSPKSMPAAKRSPAPVVSTHALDRSGRDLLRSPRRQHGGAPRTARHHDEKTRLLRCLEGTVIGGRAEEHRHLFLVAEQDVDVVEEQIEELTLVPLHAEWIGQRQGHRAIRPVSGGRGMAHRLLGGRHVPEVALQKHDGGTSDERRGDAGGRQG